MLTILNNSSLFHIKPSLENHIYSSLRLDTIDVIFYFKTTRRRSDFLLFVKGVTKRKRVNTKKVRRPNGDICENKANRTVRDDRKSHLETKNWKI